MSLHGKRIIGFVRVSVPLMALWPLARTSGSAGLFLMASYVSADSTQTYEDVGSIDIKLEEFVLLDYTIHSYQHTWWSNSAIQKSTSFKELLTLPIQTQWCQEWKKSDLTQSMLLCWGSKSLPLLQLFFLEETFTPICYSHALGPYVFIIDKHEKHLATRKQRYKTPRVKGSAQTVQLKPVKVFIVLVPTPAHITPVWIASRSCLHWAC